MCKLYEEFVETDKIEELTKLRCCNIENQTTQESHSFFLVSKAFWFTMADSETISQEKYTNWTVKKRIKRKISNKFLQTLTRYHLLMSVVLK